MVLWRPTKPSRTNITKKKKKRDILFIIEDWNAKIGSQEIAGGTGNFGLGIQNEAGQRLTDFLPREHYGHNKHCLATTQEKTLHRDIIRSSITKSDWSQRWRSSIQSAKTRPRPGVHCGSDHELYIAKFRLKLKKVGKTTLPFRYDLNQIPYDYTVEVTNRLKGLYLIECLKNYGRRFVTLYRRQGSRPSPRKRNAKIKNDCLRRAYRLLRKEEKWNTKEKMEDISIWMKSSNE